MKLLAKAHTSQRRLIEILRVIDESEKPIGARAISDKLSTRGYETGERAVRYNLKILDELGLTRKEGYSGRVLTHLGLNELRDALVDDRIGFINNRIEEFMYKTTFDPRSGLGDVVVNTSIIDKRDYEITMDILQRVFDAGYTVSRKISILDEGDFIGSENVPEGFLAICTVCSITVDGMLLKGGIPVNTTFAGVVAIDNGALSNFTELIAYDGSSLDPTGVFIARRTTQVNEAVNTGNGLVLANLREIPVAAIDHARKLLESAKAVGIDGLTNMSVPGEPNMGCPVNSGMVGIAICSGTNGMVAAGEMGVPARTRSLSMLADYSKMSEI